MIETVQERSSDFMNNILKLINHLGSEKISDFGTYEKNEIIRNINSCYLNLRNNLGFSERDSFGLEIEYEHGSNEKIIRERTKKDLNNWTFTSDRSIKDGGEFDSPILYDSPKTWKELETMCEIISNHATVGENTGSHIHIGVQVLGKEVEAWLNFLKLWSTYEHVIYHFSYGEYLTPRPYIDKYAYTCSYFFWRIYKIASKENYELNRIIDLISELRSIGANFGNVCYSYLDTIKWKNTIEFRCPNGTLNPIIWQNNVNLFMHILKYVRSDNFNNDIVMKRRTIIRDKYNYLGIEDYNNIYIEDALEFCDLVFNRNIDKVYFLRQYLKNNEVSNKTFTKAKSFTTKL